MAAGHQADILPGLALVVAGAWVFAGGFDQGGETARRDEDADAGVTSVVVQRVESFAVELAAEVAVVQQPRQRR